MKMLEIYPGDFINVTSIDEMYVRYEPARNDPRDEHAYKVVAKIAGEEHWLEATSSEKEADSILKQMLRTWKVKLSKMY